MDGWRALSIILVLGGHSHRTAGFPPQLGPVFGWCFDGNLGVRFFFIISGFLITWLLLVEQEKNGTVSLSHFYARRALRILPVYGAFLFTLFLLQVFTDFHQPLGAWFGNLTFTTNFTRRVFTSGHLWSLAVEEQFYILWPILLVRCVPLKNLRNALIILTIPLILAPLSRMVSDKNLAPAVIQPLFQWCSFFNYFDSLAVGCICAIIFANKRSIMPDLMGARNWFYAIAGIALILFPYGLTWLPKTHFIFVTMADTFQAAGFALLLLQSISTPGFYLYRFLNWTWIQWIGVLSYSIYIWQELFCTSPEVYGVGPVWWLSFPWWLIAVFTVATVSYYGLERPFLKLRSYFR